jgi:DNA/RNA endonuclease G (NUC1)
LYRVKDLETKQFIRSGVIFTSSDPSVATIDALGNVTAVGVGTTTLGVTETATDRTASFRLTTTTFEWSDTTVYADELQFGTPRDATPDDDILVNRATFAASWNPNLGQPNWVAYNLEGRHREGSVPRCDCFIQDPALPTNVPMVTTVDYDGSGYSRGHMTMSADRDRGAFDNATTFYFTNIIPQTNQNNGGAWLRLEQYLGDLAVAQNKEIFIFAGGANYSGTLNNAGRVAIPTRTWKIAVILDRDKGITDVTSVNDLKVIAVEMPNATSMPSPDWDSYRVSVASIEALTGYDFLAELPEAIECRVEVRNCLPEASIESGSYIVTEGSLLTINASGTDPDGDALVFKWTVNNNVVTAEGNVLTYIFADNGRYEVQLTVTDPHGASSIASSYVTVTNVAPEVNAFTGATGLQGETYGGEGRFMDPGADTWTATVDYGDGSGVQPLALSGKEFTLSHTYTKAGEFTVTVKVTDKDEDTGTRTATVVVRTPRQGIQDLQAKVAELRAIGALSAGNANALNSTLQAALIQLDQGNSTAAVTQLRAFVNQVNSLVAEGKLSPSNGQMLTTLANRVVASITSL